MTRCSVLRWGKGGPGRWGGPRVRPSPAVLEGVVPAGQPGGSTALGVLTTDQISRMTQRCWSSLMRMPVSTVCSSLSQGNSSMEAGSWLLSLMSLFLQDSPPG